MKIQLNNLKRLNSVLSCILPQFRFEKHEINKSEAEKMLCYLMSITDALVKAENYHNKRNLILPERRSLFPRNLIQVMGNINIYFNKFNTKIFNFSKTERQTFIFVIENIIDYFKNSDVYLEKKSKKDLFSDYKFWIENFFKIFDQKLNGSFRKMKIEGQSKRDKKIITRSKYKDFNSEEILENELNFSNVGSNFPLFPFVVFYKKRFIFLHDVEEEYLVYKDIVSDKEIMIKEEKCDRAVFDFLLSNFDFINSEKIKNRIQDSNDIFLQSDLIENAYHNNKKGLFEESYNILKDISIEDINLPLLFLVQIKNLAELNRGIELKRLLQKFMLLYPYYPDGYEILGDAYFREKNYDQAHHFYLKVMNLTQNKRIAEKLKTIKESMEKSKKKVESQKSDTFYDITEMVLQNNEVIISREKEFRQMAEILISSSRRNLLLIGDSGVGKTALIKFFTQKILDGEVPELLKTVKIKEINFVSLLTGSKYRGQFEEKVLKILNDFKFQNSILVLEDIHLMMSSGSPRGTSLDLVNILKQFLRDNTIQVIATTNYEEYKNIIEKDNSLMGFFQRITVNELSFEDTAIILNNMAKNLLSKENIIVSERIIDAIVESAKRSIKEKKLPDSAIMIFDRCISKVKLKAHMGESTGFKVEESDVVEVLSDILNLPETNVSVTLKNRLSGLSEYLLKNIVGQDEAIDRIVSNIVTSKLDFDINNHRPDGIFLFIGPTGVGKTETAIALSKGLFGSEDYLIRIDMSEYMEKFTYSRFIGAAPGYVGYYDSNQLSDKVRQNPFSVILLDEFEKADAQLLNIFLQVFDAGRLTDARGNVVDFSHATIIMTSNIGTSLFSKIQMGYQSNLEGSDVSRGSLIKSLKRYFSPEFLNRIDEIIVFGHLEENDIKKIIDIQLREVIKNLKKQGKELAIKDEVIEHIIMNNYSKEYGARNISRALKGEILEKIAHLSLQKGWNDAKMIVCCLAKGKVKVKMEYEKSPTLKAEELIEQENGK